MSNRGNVVWLALTRVVLVASGLAVQLLLANWLGDEGYGVFGFLQSVTMLVAFLAHMNLQLLVAREVAREPERASTWLGQGLAAVLLAAVPSIAVVIGYVWLFDGRADVVALALPAGLTLTAMSLGVVVQGTLQGLRQMRAFPLANLVGKLFLLAGLVGVLAAGFGLAGVFLAQAAALLVTAGILLLVATRSVGLPRLDGIGPLFEMIKTAIPFSLNRLFGSIYLASDVLIIAIFHADAEVGYYKIAALLLTNLAVVSGIFVDALYPRLAKARGKPTEAGDELTFALRMLLLMGVPMAVGGMCVATDLVDLALADGFIAAVPAMLVLLPILPVRYANHLAGSALSAFDRQPERTRSTLYAALLNVGANLALVPVLGALGAAITTLITEGLLCVWLWSRVARDVRGVRFVGASIRVGISAAGMAAVVWPLGWVPLSVALRLPLQVVAGVIVYGILSFVLRAWRISDLRRVRGL